MAESFIAELWQDNILVASVDASSIEDAEREINHYAMLYSEDGDVTIKRKYKR